MKIIETSEQAQARKKRLDEQKRLALIGCDICPCCGENKNEEYYNNIGIHNKGIRFCGTDYIEERKKSYKINEYKCLTCSARWESDKYEF